jgi:hypothetical protein
MAFRIYDITPAEARALGIPGEVTVFGPVPVRKKVPEVKEDKPEQKAEGPAAAP